MVGVQGEKYTGEIRAQILQVLSYLLPVAGRGHMNRTELPRCRLQYPFVCNNNKKKAVVRQYNIPRGEIYIYSVTTVFVYLARSRIPFYIPFCLV